MAANRSLSSFRRRERRKRPRKANNGLTAAGVRASTVTGKWRSVVKVRQRTWQKTCQTQLICEVCRKIQARFFAEKQEPSEPDGVTTSSTSSRHEIFLLIQKRHSSLAGMLHSGQKNLSIWKAPPSSKRPRKSGNEMSTREIVIIQQHLCPSQA